MRYSVRSSYKKRTRDHALIASIILVFVTVVLNYLRATSFSRHWSGSYVEELKDLEAFGFMKPSSFNVSTTTINTNTTTAINTTTTATTTAAMYSDMNTGFILDNRNDSSKLLISNTDATFTNISFFYNIYTAPNETENTERVVTEQIQQILVEMNYNGYFKSIPDDQNVNLYFNTIGEEFNINFIFNLCGQRNGNGLLRCSHLNHYNEGDEVLTLEELYNHCQLGKSEKVIYLHNKGSFHSNMKNEYLRRFMTRAVSSKHCTQLMGQIDKCNICSFQFSPIPFHHAPGNFFAAKCEYINKLIHPREFGQKMEDLVTDVRKHFELPDHQNRDSWLGLKRYSQEHWAYSHPSLIPCDLLPSPQPKYEYGELGYTSFKLAYAPRFPMGYVGTRKNHKVKPEKILNDYDPYYLLPGNLFRWKRLYNELPADGSWVWSWYPKNDVTVA